MHWVIQKSLFKPGNFELLISALERAAIEFSVVSITPKTYEISPDLSIAGPVFVCGAIRLKAVAENKGWKPGSFLNENFSFDILERKAWDRATQFRYYRRDAKKYRRSLG